MISVNFLTAPQTGKYVVSDITTGVDASFISKQLTIQGQDAAVIFDSGVIPLDGNQPNLFEAIVNQDWVTHLGIVAVTVILRYYTRDSEVSKNVTYALPTITNLPIN